MKILLDTCSFLWLVTEPEKLSKKAITLIKSKEHTFFLSSISLWEINIKAKIGKLKIEGDLNRLTNSEFFADVFEPLDFTAQDALQITDLKLYHRDPFDLMLILQAITNDLMILTPDRHMSKYKIKTLW